MLDVVAVALMFLVYLGYLVISGALDMAVLPTHTADGPITPRRRVFAGMETIRVDCPGNLAAEIERLQASRGRSASAVTAGEPQITADGCTAHIPLWRTA